MTPEFIECVARRTLDEFARYGRDPIRFMMFHATNDFWFYIERVANHLCDEGDWFLDALSYRCMALVNDALLDHVQHGTKLRAAVKAAMRKRRS